MKRVILRADDICITTHPAALLRVYGPCWEQGLPVALAVIPASAYRFTAKGPVATPPEPIETNGALCELLNNLIQEGLVEIWLHGWRHHHGEIAEGAVEAIGERLDAGLTVLQRAFPEASVRVLVPPHDYASTAGIAAARSLGLDVCSTWAATHGGGRWAHWWSRARRWAGRPLAPPHNGRWSTDVHVLDFDAGDPEDDLRATSHLLRLARRRDAPVILPQHYWRLLDEQGQPNQRHDRWIHWLAWMRGRADVTFTGFCDG